MQAEAVEPVASTSRLFEPASSLVAHTPLSLSPPRLLPAQRDGGAHSDDQGEEEGAVDHKGNQDRDKEREKEKKRRTRNGCLVCRKRKKVRHSLSLLALDLLRVQVADSKVICAHSSATNRNRHAALVVASRSRARGKTASRPRSNDGGAASNA